MLSPQQIAFPLAAIALAAISAAAPQGDTSSMTGPWYKGNLHMHSFWSDGADFPEVIAARFKADGYSFIAFTEHDQFQEGERWVSADPGQYTGQLMAEGDLMAKYRAAWGDEWVQTRTGEHGQEVRLKPLAEYRGKVEEAGKFLIVNGEETSVFNPESLHWINVIGHPVPVPPQPRDRTSIGAMEGMIAAANSLATPDQPVLAYLNHPNYEWNATAEEMAATPSLRFFEIHTALYPCFCYGDALHAGAERIWDIVLAKRLTSGDPELVYGLATDDCHRYHDVPPGQYLVGYEAHPCRAWVMVQAVELGSPAIVGALLQGRFYASTGVTLTSVESDAKGLRLHIEPQEGVEWVTQFIGTRRGADLSSEPVLDGEGKEVRTTRRFGPQVGEVLAEVKGLTPSYDFRGDELYVRAAVTSTAPCPEPTVPGDVMKAWVQPVRVAGG